MKIIIIFLFYFFIINKSFAETDKSIYEKIDNLTFDRGHARND